MSGLATLTPWRLRPPPVLTVTKAGRGRRLVAAAVGGLRLWVRRARSRRELAGLDARLRRDLGVTAEAVAAESGKPFWRA